MHTTTFRFYACCALIGWILRFFLVHGDWALFWNPFYNPLHTLLHPMPWV